MASREPDVRLLSRVIRSEILKIYSDFATVGHLSTDSYHYLLRLTLQVTGNPRTYWWQLTREQAIQMLDILGEPED